MRPGLKAREGSCSEQHLGRDVPASMRPGLKAREGLVAGGLRGAAAERFNEARA